MVKIGAHVSSSKSLDLVFDRGKEIGAETIQFFVRSPRAWAWKERTDKEKELFNKKRKETKINPLVVHASYLFNLASEDENLRKKSITGVIEELMLCEELNVQYYVIHAGKAKGQSEEKAINHILNAMEDIFKKVNLKNTTFLVETLAGQKGEIGKTTEEIKRLIEPFKTENIGVCIDTCHIYSAGYKINEKKGFNEYKKEVDSLIGLEKVKVIHCNDSKTPFNSHKDRHEHIGKGSIGLKGFELFLNDSYFSKLPFILETPKEDNMDIINIKILKSLIKAPVAQSG
ncbi:deoxyribonuclease IV [Hydrogenothermus marinus]|uniref:deoxyribonuclease IV n=1 Tax=Hydrogenothermus marinus TaxID=133270 RepID=UPI000EFA0A8D|nr:deoxyribonuclease IV [Hydrogenothermus marinus]